MNGNGNLSIEIVNLKSYFDNAKDYKRELDLDLGLKNQARS